jgi:hypothetical protein
MNHDQETEPKSKSRGSAVDLALVLPLIYLFLLGPAASFYDVLPEPMQQIIETIYLPLEFLDGVIPGNPFSWYMDLWRRW